MRRRLILALLLVVSVAPNHAAAAPPDKLTSEDCIQHKAHHSRQAPTASGPIVEISRTGNNSIVRFTFNGTGGEPQFRVEIADGTEVVNSSGFDIDSDSASRKYNAQNPWIELRLGSPKPGFSYPATNDHILVPLPVVERVDAHFTTNGTGYIGGYFALLGDYRTATSHSGCQQVMVVMPAGLDLMYPPQHYADALASASRDLDIGPRYSVVTGFVSPGDSGRRDGITPPSRSGSRLMGSEFVVSTDAQLSNPRNTWVHEYVHTRQAITNYEWLLEGSAVYFTTEIWVEKNLFGKLRADGFYNSMANDTGQLAASINEGNIPYARGAFFFTSIRESLQETNTSVEAVYRKINTRQYREKLGHRHSEGIDYDDFGNVATELSGKGVEYPNPYDRQPPVEYYHDRWFVNIFGSLLADLLQWISAVGILVGFLLLYRTHNRISR